VTATRRSTQPLPADGRGRWVGRLATLCAVALCMIAAAPAAHAVLRTRSGVSLIVAPVPTAAHPTPGPSNLTWSTGDGSPGRVTVTPDEAKETLVATGAEGSVPTPWVLAGHTYIFRLYSTVSGRHLLARLNVGHQAAAEVVAVPRKPRITSSLVDRLLQLLAFGSILALAGLTVMHIRETRHGG
jgi:hypothetical protein